MSAKHAAAFIESWYPATFFGTLKRGTPPASLEVCKFVANDTIKYQVTSGAGQVTTKEGKYKFHALYASQGKKAWVGLPPQEVGPGAVVKKLVWFVATPRATPAFLGKLDPVSKPPTATTTTTTTAPAVRNDTSSGSSSAPWIIVAVVAGVALLGAGAVVLRRRASAPSATS
jgi:MYXO-CTERM domain-containing protein